MAGTAQATAVPSIPFGDGYQCPGCGQYIFGYHACLGRIGITPAWPPLNPILTPSLTADDVRRIVREELDRAKEA